MKTFLVKFISRHTLKWEKVLRLGNRLGVDRRSMKSRRKEYGKTYLSSGGLQKRNPKDRRQHGERRNEWSRVAQWTSTFMR
jgi:hypothetical protein